MTIWVGLFTAIGYLIGFSLIPKIIVQRRESGATLAWLLAIVFLPYVGALMFWAVGHRRIRWRRKRRARIAVLSPRIAESTHSIERFECAVEGMEEPARSLAALAAKTGRAPCSGNSVELLNDAEHTFSRIEASIQSAESHVHIEKYIWRTDEVGAKLRDLLVETAKRGVEVRVLVDDVGSRKADRTFWKPLVAAGGKVARFLPVNLFARRLHLNNRNHRKIVVVDGRVGYTGGLNVGREYYGKDEEVGIWRDAHVRVEGPSVARLQEIFVEDWFHTTSQELVANRYFPDPAVAGDQRVSILACGPDEPRLRSIALLLFAAVTLAQKRVWLTTPYLIPDAPFAAALETAAMRGVDVRLLVPEKLDEPIVGPAARSFFPELIVAGVRIFEFQAGMLHAKTATVDGCWATVGSANLDPRSFWLNFEVNAVAYGPLLARELERTFERDLASAREVHLADYRKRPWSKRVIEGAARVLSPLL